VIVEVRDSDTHSVLQTLTETSKGNDWPLNILAPTSDMKDQIFFADDPVEWLLGLPLALSPCSRVYAEIVELPEGRDLRTAAFDKKAYMKEYMAQYNANKKKAKQEAKDKAQGQAAGDVEGGFGENVHKASDSPPPAPVVHPSAPVGPAAPAASPAPTPATVHPSAPASTPAVGHEPLSKAELQAAKQYQNSSYNLNTHLRNGTIGQSVDHQTQAAHLDAAMKKSPLPSDMELYRGIPGEVATKIAEQGVGAVFQDKGFVSTSKSKAKAKGFGNSTVTIQTKKGQLGLDMNQRIGPTGLSSEQEILLPRGTKFRVTKVEKRTKGEYYAKNNMHLPPHIDPNAVHSHRIYVEVVHNAHG